MKRVLFLALLLVGSLGFSQTTVDGKVVDQNNEPVPGANIVITGKAIGATADFDGNFILETSEVPPFQLSITSIGYSDVTEEITSNNQTVTIVLTEAQTFLDEVVISASRTPERIFESPVSVERMDFKEIKNTSSATFYDALENMKGVDLNTSSLTFKSVNTRGFATFSNERFMQLVDGMDNSSPALNFALGNLLGMSELDVNTVELLPGASSALYGANAFNGILFMTSKSPFDYTGISFYGKTGITSSDNAGDNNFVDAGIRAAYKFSEKVAGKVSMSFLKGTEWFATDYRDYNDPSKTRADTDYDGLNVYGDFFTIDLDFDEIAAGILPVPVETNYGAASVSRTGYNESDLMNYDAESLKVDFALHIKPWEDDFEIVLNSKIGRGNTIYQGGNRYSINDFFMQQHKLEIRNDNFFARIYTTAEKAGNSYDTRFTAVNINRTWKGDEQWFQDYAAGFLGATAAVGNFNPTPEQIAGAHLAARQNADTGRYLPGTSEFDNALAKVTSDADILTGSKFSDNSKIYHGDVNYNFAHLVDFADIMVGGSWRKYSLNSGGTIYTDADGPIEYTEFGVYTQVQKKLLDDHLKFTGSIRYDKSEFFDGFLSPRLSLVYNIDEAKKHNLRASYQTGFRNPTTQDLFIGLNAGPLILIGSSPANLDRYTSPAFTVNNPDRDALGLPETVQLSGGDTYRNAFSLESVNEGAPVSADVALVQPEQVTAYEVGYRGRLGKFSVDLSGYYNQYKNFISIKNVLVPYYGTVGDNTLSLLALQSNDFQAFQAYTNTSADINSYGGSIGINTKILTDFDFGVNYTYAKLDFDQSSDPDFQTNFNTPEHKVKVSLGNTDLFKNFGFGLNWRWNDNYLWESSFANGILPARHIFDAQISLSVPNIKSTFKVGGSNIFGYNYVSAPGSGQVGAQYFISWTIN